MGLLQRQEVVASVGMLLLENGRNAGDEEQCQGKVHDKVQRPGEEKVAGGDVQRQGKNHDSKM